MRKVGRGASAHRAFQFPFAFPQEGLSPLQSEKQAGKSAAESRFAEDFLPECGLESGGMRTTVLRLAEKKSVYCGKRCAPLRKENGDFAGALAKIRKQT